MWTALRWIALLGYPAAWLLGRWKKYDTEFSVEIWAYALMFGLAQLFALLAIGGILLVRL